MLDQDHTKRGDATCVALWHTTSKLRTTSVWHLEHLICHTLKFQILSQLRAEIIRPVSQLHERDYVLDPDQTKGGEATSVALWHTTSKLRTTSVWHRDPLFCHTLKFHCSKSTES